jgi:regulator of protease activity HflC (stomatin/prohibitin superfamily)
MTEKKMILIGAIVVVVLILVGVFSSGATIIETGNVGVKSTMGQIDRDEMKPGFNWAMPIISKIEPVFTKTIMVNYTHDQKEDSHELYYEPSLKGEDRTGLEMAIDLIIEVDPQPSKMSDMFIEVGRQGFEKKVIQPIRGAAREVLGQYNAETIMASRKELEHDLSSKLKEIFKRNPYYKLVNVQLKKIYLPKRVQEAIEKVQLTKQEAKAKKEQIIANKALAQSKIELAKGEAEAVRERAKAEADKIHIESEAQAKANKLIAKSLTKELVELKRIESWEKGGSQVPKFVSGAGSEKFLIQMNEN